MGKKDVEISRLKRKIKELQAELRGYEKDGEVYDSEIKRLHEEVGRLKSELSRQEPRTTKSDMKVSAYGWDGKKKDNKIKKSKKLITRLLKERQVLKAQLRDYEEEAQELDARADGLEDDLQKASERLKKGGGLFAIGDIIEGTIEELDAKFYQLIPNNGSGPNQIRRSHETEPGEEVMYKFMK